MPTYCQVKNGCAALGCEIAYVSPVQITLNGLCLAVRGGNIRISKLKRINLHTGYEMPSYYSLDLDDGANVEATDAVRIGP